MTPLHEREKREHVPSNGFACSQFLKHHFQHNLGENGIPEEKLMSRKEFCQVGDHHDLVQTFGSNRAGRVEQGVSWVGGKMP